MPNPLYRFHYYIKSCFLLCKKDKGKKKKKKIKEIIFIFLKLKKKKIINKKINIKNYLIKIKLKIKTII